MKYYHATIFKIRIRGIHKDILFEDMDRAFEFYRVQKVNNVDVSKIDMIHDCELDSFTKWKQDNFYGEYADGYTIELSDGYGLEINDFALEHWHFLRKKLEAELEIKMLDDTLQESDDILIETLERVHSAMSCDFGNYTEEFDTRFWKPYFNKFERKAL